MARSKSKSKRLKMLRRHRLLRRIKRRKADTKKQSR